MTQREAMQTDFSGSRLVFYDGQEISSSIGSFMQRHTAINTYSILDFLLYGTILPPRSPLEGVGQLYPGERRDAAAGSRFDYQDLDYTVKPDRIDQFVDGFDTLLTEYFATHSSPGALLLSGGIDSAILLSYMPAGTPCITWGGKGEETEDVLYARITAKAFDVKQHLFAYADYEKDMAAYERTVRALGVPLLFNSAVPFVRMAEVAQRQGITRWIMGQNADTLFMAYPAPRYSKNLSRANALLPFNPLFASSSRKRHLFETTSIVRLFAYFKSLGVYPGPWLHVPDEYFADKERLFASIPATNADQRIIMFEELLTESRRNQVCQNEIPLLYGIDPLAPFYERAAVQLALSIPPQIRAQGRYGKQVLKALARKRGVPEEVISKKKSGLSYQLAAANAPGEREIWDELERNDYLTAYIDVAALRKREEDNPLTRIMLMSLGYWFDWIARPNGLHPVQLP
jgi:asparagine synthetase B (glutamine-hydrolysing)